MAMNVSYKIRVQLPLALPELCGHLSPSLVALTGTHLLRFGDYHPGYLSAHLALSRVLSASPRRFSFESKLLIFFSRQLTSVIGFDFIGEQLVLYAS